MQEVKILLTGCAGRMGHMVSAIASLRENTKIVCGYDITPVNDLYYPVHSSLEDVREKPDVIIDFSSSGALESILSYALKERIPTVLCSTGYTDAQIKSINEASKNIALFRSGNMSLGINLLIDLAKTASSVLGADYDIEIVEKHHNKKIDAPSGTAVMIADAICETRPLNCVYDRHSTRFARKQNEIGMHSVRGGGIVGEHEVIFAGAHDTITISHSAASRELFAEGALNAAVFMKNKAPGLYNMNDLLKNIK